MNIILCGLPKSGKSTVGKLLAKRLNWDFIDTDRLIERSYALKTGRRSSCREIFLHEGKGSFREFEKAEVKGLINFTRQVISLGGGTLEELENRTCLKDLGTIIYLKASEKCIYKRLQKKPLPAYLNQIEPENSFLELARLRVPQYEEIAHYTIDINGLKESDIALKILSLLNYQS